MHEATKVVSVRMSPTLDRRVRVVAAKCDKNRSQFVIEAVREKLERIERRQCGDTKTRHVA